MLARARRGDVAAFGEFYELYSRRVLVYLTRRALDVEVAFDLTSETFAVALETCRQFRGRSAEEEQAWLFAIARTQLSRYWRRGAVHREAVARLGIDTPALTDGEIERVEALAGVAALRPRLMQALAELPPDQRRAIELRIVRECDYTEAAAQLEVSEQVVRARVSRGLRTLERSLTDRAEAEAAV